MIRFEQLGNGISIRKKLPTKSMRSWVSSSDSSFDIEDFFDCDVKVISIAKKIISNTTEITESESSLGGCVQTGFVDIKKLLCVTDKYSGSKRIVFFLEKILPFQVLQLELGM